MQTRIGLTGKKQIIVSFQELTGWKAEHPYRLFGESGEEVMVIPWTAFANADQRRLFDTLNSLGLPAV
ncbi:MAG: hypothetical protein AB8G23_05350 [Myxococcota bacterium]